MLLDTGTQIYSFAEDLDGELYFTSGAGTLHKIVPMGSPMLDNFPKKLSATGCSGSNGASHGADTAMAASCSTTLTARHPLFPPPSPPAA